MEGSISKKEKGESPLGNFFLRILFLEVLLFFSIIVLGVATALKIMTLREKHFLPPAQPVSSGNFLGAFLVATAFVILIPFIFRKRALKDFVFKAVFILAVYLGGIITLGVWVGDLALILMAVLVLVWLKFPFPILHNFSLILALVGAGALLGLSLTPQMVVAFLVLFSVYDFVAVYKTKHMIKMAKEMMKARAVMGFILPQENVKELFLPAKEIKVGERFIVLGTGDVVFPLIFVVSILPYSFFASLLVAVFGFLGILASFSIFIFQKHKKPMPALPPIALFSLLGFLIAQIFILG